MEPGRINRQTTTCKSTGCGCVGIWQGRKRKTKGIFLYYDWNRAAGYIVVNMLMTMMMMTTTTIMMMMMMMMTTMMIQRFVSVHRQGTRCPNLQKKKKNFKKCVKI
jgi:hypothetical protein